MRICCALLATFMAVAPPDSLSQVTPPLPSASPCVTQGADADDRFFECPQNDALFTRMVALSRARDVTALLGLGSRIYGPLAPDDGLLRGRAAAYELMLYAADPQRFADRYVSAFRTWDTVVYHEFSSYGDAGYLPNDRFAFDIIERRAAHGDPLAMAGVLRSRMHDVNEFDVDLNAEPIVSNPKRLLAAFEAMQPPSLAGEFLCTYVENERLGFRTYRKIAAGLKPSDEAQRAIVRQLLDRSEC